MKAACGKTLMSESHKVMKRRNIVLIVLFTGAFFLTVSVWQTASTQEKITCNATPNKTPPTDNSAETPKPLEKPAIIVRNVGEAGGFEVENAGEETELDWQVLVEKKGADKWQRYSSKPTYLNILLVDKCILPPLTKPAEEKPSCRAFGKGETLRAVSWSGWSCSAQCPPRACRANAYLGAGTYRFVVGSCDRQKEYYGEEFRLPASSPKKSPVQ